MSPSGSYCVVSGDGPRGTVAYTPDFTANRKLLPKSEHSDIAIDANGDDAYVCRSTTNPTRVTSSWSTCAPTQRTALLPTYIDGSATALHVSGKSFNNPGCVLFSTYGDYGGTQWLHKKIFRGAADGLAEGLQPGLHAGRGERLPDRAACHVNRDFTKVLFNSNWGVNSDTGVDGVSTRSTP